jgi:protocatechuate 3,4-dioxygenase beta subunit
VKRSPALFFAAVPLLFAASVARSGEIRGRLLVGDKPAVGAVVSAVPYEAPFEKAKREAKQGSDPAVLAKGVAGPDGAFTLSIPPAEPGKERLFQILVEGAGAVPAIFEGVWDASETDNLGERVLQKAQRLAGKVVDAAGAPVAGVAVTLEPGSSGVPGGDDPDLRAAPRLAVTGADGSFRFEEAGAQGNRVSAEKSGSAPAVETGLRAGTTPRPLALAPGFPVTGIVRRADKKPAAAVLVRLEARATTRWVESDEEGRFTIAHAPGGRAALVVDAGDAGWVLKPDVKLPLEEGKSLSVSLALPASLEGKLVDEKTGRIVPRAKVVLKGKSFTRFVRSGPDGMYRLKGVPPQTYRLTVDEARYVPWARADISLAPSDAKRFDIALTPGATIAGKVVDEKGTPVAAAKGSVAHGSESPRAAIRRLIQSFTGTAGTPAFRTAADGTFKASRLQPGDNEKLTVDHPDFERAALAGLSLPAGGTKAGLAVVLRRGATITGVVKDLNDQPLVDAEVELAQSANFGGGGGRGAFVANIARRGMAAGGRPRVKSGTDGAFQVKGVEPGEFSLVVRKPGYSTERVDPVKVTDASPAPLVVALGPGASISGLVKRKSGDGAEGFYVRVGLAGRGLPGPGGAASTDLPTGPDGTFLIDGLKPRQTYDLAVFGGAGLGPQKRGIVAPADGVEIVVAGTGRIAGTAIDVRSGQPLKDFTVSFEPDRGGGGGPGAFRGGGWPGAAGSGIGEKRPFHTEDGVFALEDVPAGTWTVVVSAKGYQPARVSALAVEEGATKDGVEVKVTAGTVLKGHVTDAKTGRPVANASVTHESAGGGPGGRGPLPAALDGSDDVTTDADGHFEIEGLPAGRVKVTARQPDYSDGSEIADVKDAGGTVEIKLTSGSVVGGVVVSGSQPLADAVVALAGAGEAGFGRLLGGSQTTTTDSSGRFRFDHLAPGRYTVSGGLTGKSSNLADFVLQPGDSKEDLVLSLSGGTAIQGIVSGLPDGWKSGTTVTANGVNAFFASTKVGADGSFQVTGVPAGPVNLRAQANDGSGTSRVATKEVTASDDVPVLQAEIVFEIGFTLTGHVTHSGQPAAGAMILANLQGGGGRQATTRSDDSGSYRLEGLQEGTYSVTASSDPASGGSTVRQTVAITSDQTLDLAFPTARVAGAVTDADTKQPLPDATVSLSAAPGAVGTVAIQRTVTTDSNGHFTFTDVPPQPYDLNSQKPDYQFDKRSITAADDGSSENLAIELARGAGIPIQARDGLYNVPLRSLSARVLDASKSAVYTGSIALDATGTGEIPSLKPGSYSLFVNASGYATVLIENVSVPSQTVPVTLTPGGAADITVGPKSFIAGIVRGTLRSASGLPYPYTLLSADGRLAISADATGQHGFRRIPNLAPGSYTFALDSGGGTTFSVAEGGITPVALP